MAKKKQIVINEEELTPTTLAVVEDKKKESILGIFWLFLIFAIFIVGVIYLPEISQYINNYFNILVLPFLGTIILPFIS